MSFIEEVQDESIWKGIGGMYRGKYLKMYLDGIYFVKKWNTYIVVLFRWKDVNYKIYKIKKIDLYLNNIKIMKRKSENKNKNKNEKKKWIWNVLH